MATISFSKENPALTIEIDRETWDCLSSYQFAMHTGTLDELVNEALIHYLKNAGWYPVPHRKEGSNE